MLTYTCRSRRHVGLNLLRGVPLLVKREVRYFKLPHKFLKDYKQKRPPFGYNGLGELVFYRTYSRTKANGAKETWAETVARVVNGSFSLQERWTKQNNLGWDERQAMIDAKEMYDRIFHMKFLPPGRSLWAMGTAVTEERGLFAALNNCAFVSTAKIDTTLPSDPFCFMMDAAMLGVGVGFDTLGAKKLIVNIPQDAEEQVFLVPDSREGWVESLKLQINSYLCSKENGNLLLDAENNELPVRKIKFDYSKIRKAGEPIKGFGGISSGPQPLEDLHDTVAQVFGRIDGKPLTVTAIVDVMNLIGRCVVAGNVRRTAEIAFGDGNSDEYIELKDYEKNPHRAEYGWTSNNSIFADLGMSYHKVCDKIRMNGEPGFAWLENMRNYGRMNGIVDKRDYRASGGNPCLEQTLESYELCCLVETFPDNHESIEDYKKTLELAFLYAKTVTLGHTHWAESNKVMLRNRRIGTSMSGISQFIAHKGLHELKVWCETGYDHIQQTDEKLSERFAIPKSIKTTCIKPSGTVSLLAGATPGMHASESRFYLRRIRISSTSELIQPLKNAGYHIEPAVTDPNNTLVVSIPIDAGEKLRASKDLSMWEQLSIAAFLQRHWADNQVSCTISFDPETEAPYLENALDVFQYMLKGVSFLPRLSQGAYEQMPYEAISEEEYLDYQQDISELNLQSLYRKSKKAAPTKELPRLEDEEAADLVQKQTPVIDDIPSNLEDYHDDDDDDDDDDSDGGKIDIFSSLSIDDGVSLGANQADSPPDSYCDSDKCAMRF